MLVTSTIVSLFLLPALYLRFAYGKAAAEDLDLRELWVEHDAEPAAAAAVTGDGNGDGQREVPVGAEHEAVWPS